MKLSPGQIATVARTAGVPAGQIPTAVAIALAESGGETTAHNTKPPDDSYGLWQINMLGSLGPNRRKQFNMDRNTQLFEPNANARAMFAISSGGTNWRPWSTYTSGAYLKHMGVATAGAGQGNVPITGDATDGGDVGSSGAPGGNTEGITAFTDLLSNPGTWWRVAFFLGGVVMLFMGLMSLMNKTKVGKAAIRTVKKATT